MTKSTIVAASLMILFTASVAAQTTSFNGEWKLDRQKTKLENSQLFLCQVNVIVKNDTLFTTRTYENANGEQYPFDENISLNGKDCKITIYEMPRVSKAAYSKADAAVTVESTTTFYSNGSEGSMVSKESWKTEDSGKTLAISYETSVMGNTMTGILYFSKVK